MHIKETVPALKYFKPLRPKRHIHVFSHRGKPDDVSDKNYQWEAAGVGVK